MQRREFFKVVAGVGAVIVAPSLITTDLRADDGRLYKTYNKVQLVDAKGNPILASKLLEEENYIFNYPYVGVSSFLIALPEKTETDVTLKSESGEEYIWKGGIGKKGNIVAYSSICSHQMTHVHKNESFISYQKKGQKTMACKQTGVMVCGSHLSAYDANKGCKVISGPAPQPLASIVLEHHDDDTLWAVGVLGSDKFHEFFKAFKSELKEQYGGARKAKKKVKETAQVVTLAEFTKDIIQY
ncbi:Rieske 2Fe-2S domain-containing protein [Sulfurimonas marina]|uniref:Rieske 2Fe-2S domain-containing protein n=1 Tax=Sulfurimonas marina TaxID=2590551 RepID=A0A7M1ATK9_9BACT|nr:Rieske 2Fe-2S domain-containing protein [Sulfurimonas marina]QOP40749.1 Rieske 2Fe-2S domain-containing protein [Sulfurimonas marina]